MAKKKKAKKQPQHGLSDEKFIQQRMRQLPIGDCYMHGDIDSTGMAIILITRCHSQGKYSIGEFLVDSYCLGVKDSNAMLRYNEWEYSELLKHFKDLKKISYEEAHNRIYGAIEFAEEGGISPSRTWQTNQYFLEEDTDEIPLIEYPYGKDGKHLLVAKSHLEASMYLPILKANLGDNFDYIIPYDNEENYDEEDYDNVDEDDAFFNLYDSDPEYTYECPNYNVTIESVNQPLLDIFIEKGKLGFSKETLDELLSMPHEALKTDVENIIMYYLSVCQIDHDSDTAYKLYEHDVLLNAISLLGEIGDGHSLDVIFEVQRQSPDFIDREIGDISEECFGVPIAQLGVGRLDQLVSFAKEQGLYTYGHYPFSTALKLIAQNKPELRNDVLQCYNDILTFMVDELDVEDTNHTLISFMACDLVGLQAVELQDLIEKLLDCGLINTCICGKRESVIRNLSKPRYYETTIPTLNTYDQFASLRDILKMCNDIANKSQDD